MTASDGLVEERPGGEATIELAGITKTYARGSIIACEDIDLAITEDEFVVLLGPSGCGKTTTLRCIAGLEIPDSGTLSIGGRDVTNVKPKDRDLAFVFQTIALFPHMTVRENISFGLDMKTSLSGDEKDERIREAAAILGIDDLLDRNPADLSGGQQQRVSLGRAMVMEPAAFLLDEPFSALDANLRDQMQTEIKKIHRQLDTAMVFVTHDQEEAMTLGDKIVVMRDGRIHQAGSPHDIYNDPANRFVAEFIGSPAANMLECTVEETGDGTALVNDLFATTLGGRAGEIDGQVGETVVLGIRPEYLELGSEGGFEADITLIEPQGARDDVYLDAGGSDLRATTTQGEVTEETTTAVDFDGEKAWVFDGDGTRLV